MKAPLACLLILTLSCPAFAKELTPAEQAGKIKLGAKIEVTLQSNEVLKGRRGPFSNTGFSVEPMKDGVGMARGRFLAVGDVVTSGAEGIGELRNRCVAGIGPLAL